jgi:hypothetical protein
MEQSLQTLSLYHPEESPGNLHIGDYTPSKAQTPLFMGAYDFALEIPMEQMDLSEVIRRIQLFVAYNRYSLVKYVEFDKNQSEYLMENEMLYKTHLILHHEMNQMTFVHVEIFLSHSKQAYLVEIRRMKGRNPAYGYFYRGLKECIRTGELDTSTICELVEVERQMLERAMDISLKTNTKFLL